MYDPHSGLTVAPGRVTALVGARPEETRAVAERLAGHGASGVTWGGTALAAWDRDALRRHLLLADHDAYLFAGDLRTALSGRTDRPDDAVRRALDAAAATDIADGLPGGLDGHLDDQARNVSGGQRQRLRLARALLAEPDVLLLVEPTSALDAHTEATVAARLAAHRRGRTTLVVTTSPLVLAQADEVAHLEDGKVRATGTRRTPRHPPRLRGPGPAGRRRRGRTPAAGRGRPMSRPAPAPRLPVADAATVRRAVRQLIREDSRAVRGTVVLTCLAALAGAAPWLLGRIVDRVQAGGLAVSGIDLLAAAVLGCAAAQLLLTRWARGVSHRFGERALARLREEVVDRVLALPGRVADKAGTGDLVTRATLDVATVAATLRSAAPDIFVAAVQAVFLFGAIFLLSPLLGVCSLVGLPLILAVSRWYLARSREAYLAEGAAAGEVSEILNSTALGARTVEAYGLQERRGRVLDEAVDTTYRAGERTLALRSVLFPVTEFAHTLPLALILLAAGSGTWRGRSRSARWWPGVCTCGSWSTRSTSSSSGSNNSSAAAPRSPASRGSDSSPTSRTPRWRLPTATSSRPPAWATPTSPARRF
ncbi:ABC transporter transmembrane domain-containing protein [Actinomadura keratinilytica]